MKTIHVFPSLVIAATIFSSACQKNEAASDQQADSSKKILAESGKQTPAETKIDHASALQAAELIKKDPSIVVLDVRTPNEYITGHIPDSINIDFTANNFVAEVTKLDPSKTYLVHCLKGGRSTSSLKTFSKLKFRHIIHLDGGMMDWSNEQLPVEK